MKSVYCSLCNTLVGELERGSLILRDTRYLCKTCNGSVQMWKEMAAKYRSRPSSFADVFESLATGKR